MRLRVLLATVAAACLMHVQGAAAQGPQAAPVPVAKPAMPAEAKAGEAKAPDTAPADAKAADVKPEGKPADAKPLDAKGPEGKPADTAHVSAMAQFGILPGGSGERPPSAPDCTWTGKRVIRTLIRDDVDAASQFTRFYAMFGCPTRHIGLALSCYVGRDGDSKSLEEKVDECWSDPTKPRIPVAEAAPEPGKAGSEEKPPLKN